jgi:hypothetical protein
MRGISFSLANASTVLAGTVLQPSRHKHTSFNALSKCQRKGRHKTKLSAKDYLVRALEDTRVQMLVSPPIQKNRGGRRAVCSQGFQTAAMLKAVPLDGSDCQYRRPTVSVDPQHGRRNTLVLLQGFSYDILRRDLKMTLCKWASRVQSTNPHTRMKIRVSVNLVDACEVASIVLPAIQAIKKPPQ